MLLEQIRLQVDTAKQLVLDFVAAGGQRPSATIEELHYTHRIKEKFIREAIWQLLDEGKIIMTDNLRLLEVANGIQAREAG